MEPDQISNLINIALIVLLVVSFFYVLIDRFISDQTLYDFTILPTGDPRKLSYYVEPMKDPSDPVPYPTVFNQPELYMSLVVPAYNEEKRIPSMLEETVDYLNTRQINDPNFTWEIVVVDDGSKDRTAEVVLAYARQHPEVRLLRQPFNMGKGAAVQAGSLHSRGQLILMVDADGATTITEIGPLENKINELRKTNKEAVVVGSRAHLDDGSEKANRTPLRKFLGLAFHMLVIVSGVQGIHDTQCGFKMFTREAARWLFPNQHIQRWCFDPELLVIAARRDMEIDEIPVEWNEVGDSKMKVSAMIKMAIDLVQIAIYYRLGLWTIKMKADIKESKE
ncbi:glycosyl transferase [Tritrichomonas foetus]|uniref:dolichyl-phosphate beta-glucosyltransferase n=1 Tax=Tritrichomonas foetus TaxID=1144522 RepID=A0A1J4J8I5_9EUKA|nr:glycosyl transferase [Tritrichomonas foetus]|eukprot:OHS94551.1 glycosyl transferase [Tritrichomonas foetus]